MVSLAARFLGVAIGVTAFSGPAWAQQEVPPTTSAPGLSTPAPLDNSNTLSPIVSAIEDVIGQQLQAFKSRDVDTAWQYASPMIQGMFGSAQNFGQMVSEGYPMVWDNSAVRFLKREKTERWDVQTIMVQDALGALHLLEYRMIETANGWRIDGVYLLPPPDVGV